MINEHSVEQSAPISILLVEDHLLTRIGLKTILARTQDIKVIAEAGNGEEAVRLAAELKPHVVLMDVGMPIMDGIEAARKIREQAPNINIIMLTSHDNDHDIFASLAAGASGYSLKDVVPERLYAAIRCVNTGDVWLDSAIASKVINKYSHSTKMAEQKLPGLARETETKDNQSNADSELTDTLSARELEVLKLVVEGLSNQEIATKLVISLSTAKTHVRNILGKLAVDDRTQAAVTAMRHGFV